MGSFGFGAFDDGGNDNTWFPINIPVLTMVGSLEKDGTTRRELRPDWRLEPFEKYNAEAHDSFLAVLPGQDHEDLGSKGSDEVKAFIATNARIFFEQFVFNAAVDKPACEIGTFASFSSDISVRSRLTATTQALCAEDEEESATMDATPKETIIAATTTAATTSSTIDSDRNSVTEPEEVSVVDVSGGQPSSPESGVLDDEPNTANRLHMRLTFCIAFFASLIAIY